MIFRVPGLLMQEARYKTEYITKTLCTRIKHIHIQFYLFLKETLGQITSVESGQDKVGLFRRNLLEQVITKPGSRELVENCH